MLGLYSPTMRRLGKIDSIDVGGLKSALIQSPAKPKDFQRQGRAHM